MSKETASIEGRFDQKQQATESMQDDGPLAALGFDASLFAFQLINVAIVFSILWFLILKPIVKKLEERQQIVKKSLDDAKEIESKLAMSDVLSQKKIQTALNEADHIIAKAHEKGKEAGARMYEETKEEVGRLIQSAKQTIAGEKQKMKEELHEETADLVIRAVRKIFSKGVDEAADVAFVKEALEDVRNERE